MPLPTNKSSVNNLLLCVLSTCLSLPLLAISSHILSVYHSQHATNPWWLPVWRAHFDTAGVIGVICGSSIAFAADVICLGLLIAGMKGGNGKAMTWALAGLMAIATAASLVAVIMPAVANATSPSKSDTVQTWTCRWKGAVGAPENFGSLCRQSLFSSYTPIPLFIMQLLLLAQSIQDAIAASKRPMQNFDEELVRITKSVDVVTAASGSPKSEKEEERN